MDRPLTIYTWGKGTKVVPPESQRNWHVVTLKLRDQDFNLKRMTGLSREIQEAILMNPRFDPLVTGLVEEIEQEAYQVISISCERGRHRSVAVAELLKKQWYPQATLHHLNL